MTYREARVEGAERLSRAHIESSGLDASLLLSRAAGVDRSRMLAMPDAPLTGDQIAFFLRLIDERASGVCVAYLLGTKEFRGLDFLVTPAVLVPRADTETLVETALARIDSMNRPIRVLDVCTGSGCVAVALKAERPEIQVSACDLSVDALDVARRNAQRLLPSAGGIEPVAFHQGDLLDPVPGYFDLIVSNPPYIPSADIAALSAEVRGEPCIALDGGADGLDTIRRLVPQAFEKLVRGGKLLIEAGHDQAASVAELMRRTGFAGISFSQDLARIDRVTGGTKP